MFCVCCGETKHTGSKTLTKCQVMDHVNKACTMSTLSHAQARLQYEERTARGEEAQRTMPELVPFDAEGCDS
jgi:hypothetical protein